MRDSRFWRKYTRLGYLIRRHPFEYYSWRDSHFHHPSRPQRTLSLLSITPCLFLQGIAHLWRSIPIRVRLSGARGPPFHTSWYRSAYRASRAGCDQPCRVAVGQVSTGTSPSSVPRVDCIKLVSCCVVEEIGLVTVRLCRAPSSWVNLAVTCPVRVIGYLSPAHPISASLILRTQPLCNRVCLQGSKVWCSHEHLHPRC